MTTQNFSVPLSYTVKGVNQVTGLGRSKIYELMNEGVLHKFKIGRRTLIRADSVRALILDMSASRATES